MNKIDLRKVDLNLLLVFEVLMKERSVTRSAQHLALTQSAVSHALERLRQQLEDPLLVRQGSEMVPSPFALELIEQVRPLLREVAYVLTPKQPFVPAQSKRVFRLAMGDFLADFFPRLVQRVQQLAPQVRLDWVPVRVDVFAGLTDGSIDLFLGPGPLTLPIGLHEQAVGRLTWACYVRAGHPAITQWNPSTWAEWPHIQVGTNDALRSPVEQAASQAGLSRKIAASVPLFSAVAPLLAQTQLMATLPRAVMAHQLQHWQLVELPLPFPIDPIPHAIYTARRMAGDQSLLWFIQQMSDELQPFLDPNVAASI